MPNLSVMTEEGNAVFRQYLERQSIAKEVLAEIRFNERWEAATVDLPGAQKKNDIRDFDRMVGLFEAEGQTEEERRADIKQKVTQMEEAFLEKSVESRKPYLDMLYNFRDNFDLSAIDMEKPEDLYRLFVFGGLSQTFGVKKGENQQYYEQRYPTPERRRLAEAKDRYALIVSSKVLRMLSTAGLTYNVKGSLTLAGGKEGEAGYEDMFYDYAEWEMKNVEAEMRQEAPSGECRMVLSETMACFNDLDISKLHNIPGPLRTEAGRMESIVTGNLHTYDTAERTFMRDIGVKPEDLIFIDGKSITELIQEKYPGNSDYDLHNCILATALASGKSRVEFVSLQPQEDGGCEYVTKTIHADYRKTDPPKSHSWLRRLFNWGPFKMRQDRQDSLLANDPDKEERHRGMCAKAKNTIETRKQETAEKRARQARAEMERKAAMERKAVMTAEAASEKVAAVESSQRQKAEAAVASSEEKEKKPQGMVR